LAAPPSPAPRADSLEFPVAVEPIVVAFLAAFVLLASCAAAALAADTAVPERQAWSALLACALLFGAYPFAIVLRALVQGRWPARLSVSDGGIRVELWRNWGGLSSGFGRARVTFVRGRILGVELHPEPDGRRQLLLVHASGLALVTGWSGGTAHASALAASLLGWTTPCYR
jgi:hypothetical protein